MTPGQLGAGDLERVIGLPLTTIKSWEMMESYISPAALAPWRAKRQYSHEEAFRLLIMRHLYARKVKPEHSAGFAKEVLDQTGIGRAIRKYPERHQSMHWYKAAQRFWIVNHDLDRQVGTKLYGKKFDIVRLTTSPEDGDEHAIEYFNEIGRFVFVNSLVLNVEGVMARFIVNLIGEEEFERMPIAGRA